ncbi:MAG: SRPBCC family protein [Saprospiraceae bacterium]
MALVLIVALFVSKSYSLDRSITINKPKSEVFDYISYLKNQDYFNKWVMADPHMKKDFRGTDGQVGFVYLWDGNKKAGKGEQQIKAIVPGQRLDVEIRFIKPFEGIAQTAIVTETLTEQQTKVNWSMSSSMKYPMNIALLIGIDKMLGKDLQDSLNNLKGILEANQKA